MTRIPPILLLAVLGGLAFFSISKIQFSASIYELLPQELPEVRGMDQLNRFFSRNGQLIVTIETDEPYFTEEAAILLADRLEAEPDLVEAVHRELALEDLIREGSGLLGWMWLNSPPESVLALANRLQAPNSERKVADAMKKIRGGLFDESAIVLGYDPLGISRLEGELGKMDLSEADPMTSPDGKFRILYVEGAGVDFSDYRDAEKWLNQIRGIVRDWKKTDWPAENAALEIGLTGTPAFMAEVGREMEKDMTISVVATMLLIALLFYILHRQSRPLSWLIAAMLLILALTLNIGRALFGELSVMSAGFAAVLMGLAVDYGIVFYREAMGGKKKSLRELRKRVSPSILWAAATTAVVFLSLNLSSLPGIAELGNLVAIGIAIGALVMIWLFAPIAVEFARQSRSRSADSKKSFTTGRSPFIITAAFPILVFLSILWKDLPGLEAQFHPFRIRASPSVQAWQKLQSNLQGRENSIPTVITAESDADLIANLKAAEIRFEEQVAAGKLERFVLPTSMVPNRDFQQKNAAILQQLIGERDRLLSEIDAAGFSKDGSALTRELFRTWETALPEIAENGYAKPSGQFAEWAIGRLFTVKNGTFAALGTVKPVHPRDRDWVDAICNADTSVASLGSLGTALNERMADDLKRVFLPMMCLLAVMLGIVFREWRDLVVALFALAFSAGVLLVVTVWTPMSWNSFNVCGLPLLFGTGLDFGIHMIFALRRNGGDIQRAREGIGKALLFCGTSSAIGFGSLIFASADGLASLGLVCAVGILVNMTVAVWLLPRWWKWMRGWKAEPNSNDAP
ncbi:MAG: MMPL family transporter [Verrucomicrobiales bacterium]|nr:MMPL family transporter [Verrucomicrobiales bacterium]